MTRDKLKTGRLVAFFLCALLLFNYPLLSLFNHNHLLFGIPLLYLYFFSAWLVVILLTFWSTRGTERF